MPSSDYTASRIRMLDCQVRPSGIDDDNILLAFGRTPKELFVPSDVRSMSYSDDDILVSDSPPRRIISPTSMARLYQLGGILRDDRVLDIGCTTGYSTAILSHLCYHVTGLENDRSFVRQATESLSDIGCINVDIREGRLSDGYASGAPYDVIFIGGAIDVIPDSLRSQLSASGRIVAVHGVGNSGVATLHSVSGKGLSSSPSFNCSIPPLPDFASPSEFVF